MNWKPVSVASKEAKRRSDSRKVRVVPASPTARQSWAGSPAAPRKDASTAVPSSPSPVSSGKKVTMLSR